MRRTEIFLLLGFVAAVAISSAIAMMSTSLGDLFDIRRSTNLNGPEGVAGLALTLERLGVPVEQRRRALFDLANDSASVDTTELLALVDLTSVPSRTETIGLKRYVERGGSLFIGSWSYIEICFGWTTAVVDPEDADSVPLALPVGAGAVPATTMRLTEFEYSLDEDDDEPKVALLGEAEPEDYDDCVLTAAGVDTLLVAADGEPVAVRLRVDGGGRVTLLADSDYLTNRVLRDTDAGAVFIPILLADSPSRVVFDEYHHGFGTSRSMWLVAGAWLATYPAGWAVLQLAFVGLLALALAAVRFGPARSAIERERRSGLEHLNALAVGFERARARRTATELIAGGLRRRLARTTTPRRTFGHIGDWLASLSLAATAPSARADIERLRLLMKSTDADADVLETAKTVERIWEALGK